MPINRTPPFNSMNLGFGFADAENLVAANPNTVMRIASISKSMTMAAAGKLIQEGKLDLDSPVTKYLDTQKWDNKGGEITVRQLVSHLSGIRHYETKEQIEDKKDKKNNNNNNNHQQQKGDGRFKEFHIQTHYDTVGEALELFKKDQLLHEPGRPLKYITECGQKLSMKMWYSRQHRLVSPTG